jgi:hypothetical protein
MKLEKIELDSRVEYRLNGVLHREDGPAVECTNGYKEWYKHGIYHREGGPAIEYKNGSKSWCLNGKLHREDGPAIEGADEGNEWWIEGKELTEEEFKTYQKENNIPERIEEEDGTIEYRLDGKLHREDGPAVEGANGDKIWCLNGKCHREDGPAIEYANGDKHWYLNGKCHREDGPAVEWADGDKSWYLNGERHREDGPAVEWADGEKHWWVKGNKLTEEEFVKSKQERKVNIHTLITKIWSDFDFVKVIETGEFLKVYKDVSEHSDMSYEFKIKDKDNVFAIVPFTTDVTVIDNKIIIPNECCENYNEFEFCKVTKLNIL